MLALARDVAASSIYRVVVLVVVLTVAVMLRRRAHWPVWCGASFGIASNAFYLANDLTAAGYFGIPFLGLIAWALIDYMRHDALALRTMLAKKEAEWSHLRHELTSDKAAQAAELFVLRDRADDRDARADERDRRQDIRDDRQDTRESRQDARDDPTDHPE